jgi:8-oxo-dGTP pyrophosphatase MutT (NUDIX family)
VDKWTVLDSRVLLSRPPWLKVTEERCQLPNGYIINGYLLVEGRDVAMVYPYTDDGNVLLVEQYKHGADRVEWDLPAGYIDAEDASPLEAAKRELAEETGCTAREWVHLASLCPDPNRSANQFYFYLALGVERTLAQHLDPTEELVTHTVPVGDLERLISEGKIASMGSVAGIGLAASALARRGLLHRDQF